MIDEKQVRTLRQWRDLRFMTQDELAERSGLSKHTILRLEAGRHRPTARTIKGLMGALDVDPLLIAEVRQALGLDEPKGDSRG